MMNNIKYRYIRDEKKRPMVTMCLIEHGDSYSMGVAICSEKDNPAKKIGRGISYGRAMKALNSGGCDFFMRPETNNMVHELKSTVLSKKAYLELCGAKYDKAN